MKFIVTEDYEAMSRTAARVISGYVSSHPDCVLGLATGSTPIGLYRCLVEDYEAGALSFKDVTSFNLDEYRGLDPQHDQSYRYFMEHNLFSHVDSLPYSSFSAIAVTTESGMPLYAGPNTTSKSSPKFCSIACA